MTQNKLRVKFRLNNMNELLDRVYGNFKEKFKI